jgi:hypothetical protein
MWLGNQNVKNKSISDSFVDFWRLKIQFNQSLFVDSFVRRSGFIRHRLQRSGRFRIQWSRQRRSFQRCRWLSVCVSTGSFGLNITISDFLTIKIHGIYLRNVSKFVLETSWLNKHAVGTLCNLKSFNVKFV